MSGRAFTIDWHGTRRLNQGDGILTARGVYRVLEAHEVNSRQWRDRWRYRTEKAGTRERFEQLRGRGTRDEWEACRAELGFAPDAWIIETQPYEPGGRPGVGEHRCDNPACEGCRA